MDDDAPQRGRSPLVLILSLVSGFVVVAAGAVGGLLWLISRQGPPPKPRDSQPPPPDDEADGGGGGTGAPDNTPSPNEVATASGADGDGAQVEADGCEEDVSCEGPSCETSSCEAPACESGTNVVSAGVSVLSVLPLVTVDRLAPRRELGRRARVSAPARCGLMAIRGYRRFVSPRTPTRCRYVPSCSGYGAATIASYGLANGSRLALRRIRRCTRRVPMGTVDPPP